VLDRALEPSGGEPAGTDPMRLTRALAHDLRASLHGLSLALEMLHGTMQAGAAGGAQHYLNMARAEAAQLDRTIEQLGLWIRLLGGEYRAHPQRVDLRAAAAERLAGWTPPKGEPVMAVADRTLLAAALDGLGDFLRAYAHTPDGAGLEVLSGGRMRLFGPQALVPVLRSVVAAAVPDLRAAKGPAVWLVGPALAVSACRVCGGNVWLEQNGQGGQLWLNWVAG
jgi:hypothetical protein